MLLVPLDQPVGSSLLTRMLCSACPPSQPGDFNDHNYFQQYTWLCNAEAMRLSGRAAGNDQKPMDHEIACKRPKRQYEHARRFIYYDQHLPGWKIGPELGGKK
jgi:hypothetical protein